MGRSEAYRKLVLMSTADYSRLVGVFSDPDNPFGVHKDFHAVHIFKHHKLHVCLLLTILKSLRNVTMTERFARLYRSRNEINCMRQNSSSWPIDHFCQGRSDKMVSVG